MRTRLMPPLSRDRPRLHAPPFAPASAQPKEVVIGLIYPLSGPTASAGVDEKHVYELFADMVNGKEPMIPGTFYQQLKGLPGIAGGARLRLIFVDHQGKPDIGQAEAERLITQEKVHAPRGRLAIERDRNDQPGRGALRHPALQFRRVELADAHAARVQVVLPVLAPRRALHAGDVRLPSGLPEEAERQGRDDRHLQRGHPLRDRLAKTQRALAQKSGYKIVADFAYRANSTTLTAEVQKLKAANPDVWFPTSYQSDAILFTRTTRELDQN